MNTDNFDTNSTASRLKRRPLRHLNELRDGINVSFEYFPPKTASATQQLQRTGQTLERFRPSFSSVTYGAGGSIETHSFATLRLLRQVSAYPIAAHITHIGTDKLELDALAERLAMLGIERIVALRGDLHNSQAILGDSNYASTVAMIQGLKRLYDFDISVAGYPETHPEATSRHADIEYLKRKIDAGANRVLCQFCFDSNRFLSFRDHAVRAGITVPIIPGILPVHNFSQVQTFAKSCATTIPTSIVQLFSELPNNQEIFDVVSSTVTAEFCTRLIDNGVTDLHFYTLNRSKLVRAICHILGLHESNIEQNERVQIPMSASA